MLGRAIVPLLRPRNFPPAVRLSILNQTRYYARDRKSKPDNDYKLPATAARPAWQQTPHTHGTIANAISHEQHSSQTQEPSASEYSDLQPEFETSANDPKNDTQSSEELQFSSRGQDVDRLVKPSANPPRSQARPEVETSSSAEGYSPAGSHHVERSSEDLGSPVSGDEQTASTQQPLPDLTQGIPSTLDAELREARLKKEASTPSLNITEDPSAPTPSSGGRGAEGLPKSAYISSNEKKKNN